MKTLIDKSTWNRRVHFEFFSQFDDPSFEMTAKVNCTKAYLKSKELKQSFFLSYLYASMKAVNALKEFKVRIEDGELYEYKHIHAGPTIARPNGTFGFSHLPFYDTFEEFCSNANTIIDQVKKATDLNPSFNRNDVIHYSSIPWVDFTGIKHPVFNVKNQDSVPKISFGKMTKSNSEYYMSVSIQANHALIDGKHIGEYLDQFQYFLDQ